MLTKKQKASGEEKLISSCRLISFNSTVSSKNAVILSLRVSERREGGREERTRAMRTEEREREKMNLLPRK
jgi:hypothetical protein